MKMTNKLIPGTKPRRLNLSRLVIIFAIVAIAASCTSTTPVRPTSTGKTIKTSTAPPDHQPIIEAMIDADPGITDTEI